MNTISPMKEFRWQIAVFDDFPDQYETDAIAKVFDVKWFSSLSEILKNVKKIQNSHVAIIDMKWNRSGCLEVSECESEFPYIPTRVEMRQMSRGEIAKRWICGIGAWATKGELPDSDEEFFPANKIEQNEVGAWIGAMVSHVAPATVPVFVTGFKDEFRKGMQAPLGLFSNAAFVVNNKTDSGISGKVTVEGDEFWRALHAKQIDLLRNLEVGSWFFSKVLINLLSGIPPGPADCGIFYHGYEAVMSRRMIFENVFPNLVGLQRAELIKKLRPYFQQQEFSDRDFVSMQAVRHSLNRRKISSLDDLKPWADDLREAYQYALVGGEWSASIGVQISSLVHDAQKASHDVDDADLKRKLDDFRSRREMILNILDSVLIKCDSSINDIFSHENCCVQLSSSFNDRAMLGPSRCFPSPACHQQPTGDWFPNSPGLRFLRFPVGWLGEMLLHLHDNAEKPENNCAWRAEAFEQSWNNESFFVFRFLSEWKGDLDWTIFWTKVRESNYGKGEFRGLPLVVRRALESGANAFFLKAGSDQRFVWSDDGLTQLESEVVVSGWDFQFCLIYRIVERRATL